MDYLELYFTYISPVEVSILNDILAAELGEIGFDSFVEETDGLQGYIPSRLYNEQVLKEKLTQFPIENTVINFKTVPVEKKNWNEEWEKHYFKPIRIGNECLIRASFHPDEPGYAHTIIIDPKMSFGTGNHETTFLMINEMIHLDLSHKKVLDMGCGTGVLAILAHMKGAEQVIAVDIDEWAYDNTLENCRLNGTEQIRVLLGGAETLSSTGTFDVVFANINRNILLEDIRHYNTVMNPGSYLFMSGFYQDDIPVIEIECNKNGLKLLSFAEKNRWVAVKVIKNGLN